MLEAQSHHGAGAALHMQGLLIISDTAQRAIIFKTEAQVRGIAARLCFGFVGRYMWCSAPRTGTVYAGLGAPHPNIWDRYMWVLPHTGTGGGMGIAHNPTEVGFYPNSRDYFWEKAP